MAFPVVFPLPHNRCSWFCFFLVFLVSFFQLAYSVSLNNNSTITNNKTSLCRSDQSLALLQFKSSFTIEVFYGNSKLWSWEANTDCCSSWDGVTCDDFGLVIGLDVSESGLVGDIDSNNSLFNLHHLQTVNLAFNDFNSSSIPAGFVRLNRSLTHLNLSCSRLSGEVPLVISQLTNLISLDLSELNLVVKSPNTLRTLTSNFSSLKELHLDAFLDGLYNSTTSAYEWLSVIASAELHHLQVLTFRSSRLAGSVGTSLLNSSSLSHLDLSYNDITHFPQQMFHLPNLKILDLSWNSALTGSLPEFPPGSSTLQQLFLGNTNFSGRIPHSIGNLKQLTNFEVGDCGFFGPLPHSFGNLEQLAFLGLSGNNFEGEIPCSFSKLSHLKEVDMSSNRFVGPLPSLNSSRKTIELIRLSSNNFSGPIPSSYYANNGLPSLIYLALSNNQLNGSIPPSLFSLPCLQEMYLYQNKFIGILEDEEEFPYSFSSPLVMLDLSYNLLEGNIPNFISKLTSLRGLYLNSNNFHGVVDPRVFASLKNLTTIDLSSNIMLSIDASDIAINIPNLSVFNFSSCNLSVFPRFLRHQTNSYNLDLSNNQLQGRMPAWLWNKVETLDLSHNSLIGFEDHPITHHFSSSLYSLDLSSNSFEGPLPIFPKDLTTISLSKNNFTGAIPMTICNTSWIFIDLSHNQISGEIPSCLFNRAMVKVTKTTHLERPLVDLSKNKLEGIIPDNFDTDCRLQGLNLNGNQLEGQLPRSLANCLYLTVLDLGNNQIDDTFPFWLEHLEKLQVLMLQSNRFHGPIRRHNRANSSFESLHIIGLSTNNFTGHLPLECFPSSYLTAELHQDHFYSFRQDVTFTFLLVPNKGQALEYATVQIPELNVIDLSSNRFDGEIPTSIGDFRLLMVLNLSHNSLVGKIPSSLANLTQLQSLDLSNNDLVGEIPSELTSLTFLTMFDASQNDLIGTIPSGGQFDTFSSSSFEGNSRLCGSQLQIDCNPKKSGSDHANQSNGTNFEWIFAVAGYASGLIVGVVIEQDVLSRNRYYLEKFMNTIRFFQGKRPLRVRSLRRRRN
ncbi:hypothetical protein Sjap_021330 [Stephania japonica]|uniref:Leucine-rich repeat-containing N-terminal plant-type domain-containing protein n=1 Tax=Stephania japonica TaxID=461633 RepID=A0AAP0HNX7_9MAGN